MQGDSRKNARRTRRQAEISAQALEIAGDDTEALNLFRRCDATYDTRRLERRQRNQRGEHNERREQTEKRSASLLSAREREIALLAVSGRTNLEIANQPAITHKTVEKHLGSVYQKLQASSRAQLGAREPKPRSRSGATRNLALLVDVEKVWPCRHVGSVGCDLCAQALKGLRRLALRLVG